MESEGSLSCSEEPATGPYESVIWIYLAQEGDK